MALLCKLPSQQWARGTKRAKLIEEYLQLEAPTVDDASEYAAQLGLKMRMFYDLVRIYKEARDGAVLGQRHGRGGSINPRTANVIEQAIADLGPGGTESEIFALATQICTATGAPAPSATAVRTRVGRRHSVPDVATRINRRADLVLDGTPLSMDVYGSNEDILPANLCGLVHVRSGAILGHQLVPGTPDAMDALNAVADALSKPPGHGRSAPKSLKLLISSGVQRPAANVLDTLAGAGIEFDGEGSKHLRPGAAMIATLGLQLGRVRLLPLRRSSLTRNGFEPIAMATAAPIIARLIEDRNLSLATTPPAGLQELLPRRQQVTDLMHLIEACREQG